MNIITHAYKFVNIIAVLEWRRYSSLKKRQERDNHSTRRELLMVMGFFASHNAITEFENFFNMTSQAQIKKSIKQKNKREKNTPFELCQHDFLQYFFKNKTALINMKNEFIPS